MYYEQVSTSLVKRENGFALVCIQSPSKTIVTHYGNCNNCPLPLFHFGICNHIYVLFIYSSNRETICSYSVDIILPWQAIFCRRSRRRWCAQMRRQRKKRRTCCLGRHTGQSSRQSRRSPADMRSRAEERLTNLWESQCWIYKKISPDKPLSL